MNENKSEKKKLKGARVTMGLTQQQIARLINMPTSTYVKKENKQTSFTIEEAFKICRVLDMSIESLFLED